MLQAFFLLPHTRSLSCGAARDLRQYVRPDATNQRHRMAVTARARSVLGNGIAGGDLILDPRLKHPPAARTKEIANPACGGCTCIAMTA
jgi:hypothetical protein